MITAQDIREKTFEKATFGGYAMNEVDDFLDELAGDIAATQKEAAVLRGKMKVLVDKIEEYRSSEDEMNRALVSAQKLARSIEEESRQKADAIIAEAQEKADAILAEAQEKADAITGNLRQLREAEELRHQKAQNAAAEKAHTHIQRRASFLQQKGLLLRDRKQKAAQRIAPRLARGDAHRFQVFKGELDFLQHRHQSRADFLPVKKEMHLN